MLHEVTLDYTFETYETFVKFFYDKVSNSKKVELITSVVFVVLGLMALGAASFYHNPTIATCGCVMILMAIVNFYIYDLRVKLNTRRTWNSSKYAENGLKITIRFFDTYLEQESKVSTLKMEYEKLYKAFETESYFYLMISANQAVIVKRENCDAQTIAFLQNLVQNVTEANKKTKE